MSSSPPRCNKEEEQQQQGKESKELINRINTESKKGSEKIKIDGATCIFRNMELRLIRI